MKSICMQDKRARKRIPAVGTKKYPVFYLGEGEVTRGKIKTNGMWPFQVIILPDKCRFYAVGKRSAKWLENISSVEMGHYWRPPGDVQED